jgi:hypothetical protein
MFSLGVYMPFVIIGVISLSYSIFALIMILCGRFTRDTPMDISQIIKDDNILRNRENSIEVVGKI